MAKGSKPIEITILVGYSIWLAVSIFFFSFGIGMFVYALGAGYAWYWSWLLFGLFCTVPSIKYFWQIFTKSVKDNYREGANSYSVDVTVSSSSVTATTKNHALRGIIFGIVIGLVVGLAFGPVFAALVIITYTIKVIKQAILVSRLFPRKGKKKVAISTTNPAPSGYRPQPLPNKVNKQENIPINRNVDKDEILETSLLSLFAKEINVVDKRFSLEYEDDFNVDNKNLVLTHYQIVKDSLSLKTILRLEMKNISIAKIKAVHLEITAFDNNGARLGYIKDIAYKDHLIDINESANAEMGIVLPKECTNGVISIKKIVFEDDLFFEEKSNDYSFASLDKFNSDMELYMKLHEAR